MSVKMRQIVEKEIASAVIDALLKAGFTISVDNGDNSGGVENEHGELRFELEGSISKKAVFKAMFLTDEDRLYVTRANMRGWVYFIYGNNGWDVINDYTVNLDPFIGDGTEVQKVIDKYAD